MKERFGIDYLDKYGKITYRVFENRPSSIDPNQTWKLSLKSFDSEDDAKEFIKILNS